MERLPTSTPNDHSYWFSLKFDPVGLEEKRYSYCIMPSIITGTLSELQLSKLQPPEEKGRPRCYAKSPTAQDMLQPILGLIWKLGLLSHAQNTANWLHVSIYVKHVIP